MCTQLYDSPFFPQPASWAVQSISRNVGLSVSVCMPPTPCFLKLYGLETSGLIPYYSQAEILTGHVFVLVQP